MRRKSKRKDRYISGTASARVRGPSFFCAAVIIRPGMGEYFDYAWKIMAWMPCRCTCAVAGRRRRGRNEGMSALQQEAPGREAGPGI